MIDGCWDEERKEKNRDLCCNRLKWQGRWEDYKELAADISCWKGNYGAPRVGVDRTKSWAKFCYHLFLLHFLFLWHWTGTWRSWIYLSCFSNFFILFLRLWYIISPSSFLPLNSSKTLFQSMTFYSLIIGNTHICILCIYMYIPKHKMPWYILLYECFQGWVF